jgi:hypothetical protein
MNTALRNDLARALRNFHYEAADDGRILLPQAGVFIGGSGFTDVNGEDRRVIPNVFTAEGLTDVLKVAFKQGSAATAFYLAPFSGNVDPDGATLTAANFATNQTEFTAYNESTRQTWTPADPTTPSIGNAASLATFTNTTAGATVWGFGFLTNQVKSATTGKLYACWKDTTARDNLHAGDKLNLQYGIVAQDAG